jgi:peptide deformylase
MVEIVQKEAPVLRQKAKEVKKEDFGSKHLKDVLLKMAEGLHQESDAVAIAAPQIGEALRIFMVLGSVFLSNKRKKERNSNAEETKSQDSNDKKDVKIADFNGDFVFINPKIVSLSKTKKDMDEGCLSVRLLYGKVKRCEKVKIEAFDFNGNKVVYGASGLISQIFQHEIDHLEGVLFIDKATKLMEISREELEKYQKDIKKQDVKSK